MTSIVAVLGGDEGFMVGPSEKAILRKIEHNEVPREVLFFNSCKLQDDADPFVIYWTRDLYSIVAEVYEND